MHDAIAKAAFVLSAALLVFLAALAYGFTIADSRLWPYRELREVRRLADELIRYGRIVPENLVVTAPADMPAEAFHVHREELLDDGFYFLVGWNEARWGYSAWLYDQAGTIQHRWDIDYLKLDSDGPLNGADMPHAVKVLPDGSVILGFDKGDVMARIDACANPIWTKQGTYHHSLEGAYDGTMWTWRANGTPYAHFNYIENFDPTTGETIREIDLIRDIIQGSADAATIFAVSPDYEFKTFDKDTIARKTAHDIDLFHPNDVEVLSPELAQRFPGLNAGDLLLSFRTLHLIAVIDGENYTVKWSSHGPWRFQHDPDFTDDGRVSVYNNNAGRSRSSIIKIDPVSGHASTELLDGDLRFYSSAMGKHQYMPNGNVLIVVPGEGRVIEVAPSGDKVLEINNRSTRVPEFNMHVENAAWLPVDFFVQMPECNR